MPVLTNPAGYLFSARTTEGVGSATDTRTCQNYGYLFWQVAGNSAVWSLEASHDLTAWLPVGTYTATATQTGTAQIAAYLPYVRARASIIASAAGGTAQLTVFYAPGLV